MGQFSVEKSGLAGSVLSGNQQACREFFKAFEGQNFADLSAQHIQKMVNAHHLSVDDLLTGYSRKLKDVK